MPAIGTPIYSILWPPAATEWLRAVVSKMATKVDVLLKALADLNVVATRKFTLKPEQEIAARSPQKKKKKKKRCGSGFANRIWQKHEYTKCLSSPWTIK